MYIKYNSVLRGLSVGGVQAPLEALYKKLCLGNKYGEYDPNRSPFLP